MQLGFSLLDHIHLNSHLHANFACDYSEDGQIFILSEPGVFVLTLKGYMESVFPRFSFRKDLIKLESSTLCENLDIDLRSIINDLTRQTSMDVLLDVTLSGNSLNTAEMEAKPVMAMWSPRGIVEKTNCVLAVLTNLRDIEIYSKTLDENEITSFVCVANFSKSIADYYRRAWKRMEGSADELRLHELKKRVNFMTPSTFTWSHVVLKDRKAGCILFVGHSNGAVTAWRFIERKENDASESKLEFLNRYETKIKNITALHWFCQKSDAGGLSVGDSEGRVSVLSVSKLSTDNIKFSAEVVLNTECDLKVDKITIMSHQNITYVIAVKLNYLLIYAINEFGEVFQGKLLQVGNLYITGVLHYEKNVLLVLSLCGQLKQVELNTVNNEIVFTEEVLQLNIDSNKYRTHGFLFSPNKVFLGVLAYPCQQRHLSRGKNFTNFFIFKNTLKNPFDLLMTTTSNTLRDFWDCFETLRVSSIQDKKFAWEGIDPNLNYDTLPLMQLKVLRWVAKLSEVNYPAIPRVAEYNIKAYALLNYAVDIKLAIQRMNKLLDLYYADKPLTLFQMQSLDLLNFFLKEIVAMDVLTKANLGTVFIDEIYNVMQIANEVRYPPPPQCIWCGEKIIGSSCVLFHVDSRCAISLMPIKTLPGYKCPFCKCVVSREMDREYHPIFCPYCDIPMERRCFDKRPKKGSSEQSKQISLGSVITQLTETVTSECKDDCLHEAIDFNDIEENSADYIVLTDSEDEDGSVRELYDKMKNVVLTDQKSNSETLLTELKKPSDEDLQFQSDGDDFVLEEDGGDDQ